MILASIIICTYNRPDSLESALDGLTKQSYDVTTIEVIVIDNSLERPAFNVTSRYKDRISNLIYEVEPDTGLSYARNRGIKIANGEWLFFLDDDAIPCEGWIQNMVDCIHSAPNPVVVGGKVIPLWPYSPPKWCTPDAYPVFSIVDYEGTPVCRPMNFPKEYPVGANIAYRKDILTKFGGFKTNLGRRGDILLLGEETELNFRIHMAGHSIWYCPNAVVQHQIPTARLNKHYVKSGYYWGGVTGALLDYELFGVNYLRKEIFMRFLKGVTIYPLRAFTSVVIKGKHPLILQYRLLLLLGYLRKGISLLRESDDYQFLFRWLL